MSQDGVQIASPSGMLRLACEQVNSPHVPFISLMYSGLCLNASQYVAYINVLYVLEALMRNK